MTSLSWRPAVRAVICHQAVLTVEDVPDLAPHQGQVLLEVARCGICGSDLHARVHCDETAALTEPLAVALHAVRRGEVGARDTAVVIGCGPIGLAVIAMLKATGVRHVIASDFSAGRRQLAETMGADIVVNPANDSPWSSFADSKRYSTEPVKLIEAGIKAMNMMRAVPFLPWAQIVRAAGKAGGGPVDLRPWRSEEHTSELQSRENLVCRLLLEKKNRAHTTVLA